MLSDVAETDLTVPFDDFGAASAAVAGPGDGDGADFRRVQCAVHVVIRHFNVVANLHDFAEFGTGRAGCHRRTALGAGAAGFNGGLAVDAELHVDALDLDADRIGRHSRHRAARGLGWLSERGSGGPAGDYECSEGKCYERPSHIGLLSE